MKKHIIKIEHKYNSKGEEISITIIRGSYYLERTSRTYKYNCMSDAQHNLNIALSNRDKWTSFFFKDRITAYPAWFDLCEGDKVRAAGTLGHCKHFFKPGRKIVRRMNYPKI